MSSEVIFGRFVISLPHRQLWHNGVAVTLKPKEAELLTLLAERRPSVVSRDEIVDRLWRGVASDAAVSQTIYRLRQALARFEEADYIRTLPDVGFQLSGGAPIEERNPAPEFRHPEFGRYQHAAQLYARGSESDILAAIGIAESILENAPAFVGAQVLLAKLYTNSGIRLFYRPAEAFRRARTLLEGIIESDPVNADALATLSILLLFFTATRSHAREAAERALVLAARSPLAHDAAVWERLSRRDFSAALTQADLAVAANPASGHATALIGAALYMSGQFEEARRTFRDALTLDRHDTTALLYAAYVEAIAGNAARADELSQCVRGADGCSRVLALRGYLAAKSRRFSRAERSLADLRRMAHPSQMMQAMVLSAMERYDDAAAALTSALATREPGLFLSAVDPLFAPLWERYPELFHRIGAGREPQCDFCSISLTSVAPQALHRRTLCWKCRPRLAASG